MKKLIAIAVLCVASMAFGAAADLDLVASIVDGDTILTNNGTDEIAVGTLGFTSSEGRITATAAGGKFTSYIGLPNGAGEISFITFGPSATLAAGESTNIGVIASHVAGDAWAQAFVDADPEPVYYFDLVPEPASMSMLALGGLALIRRRK